MVDIYRIQQWLFDTAGGGYDFDLAKSHMQAALVRDVTIRDTWDLDYTADRGLETVRRAVADLYGPRVPADRVLMANGAQEALYLFYRCLLAPGDHVVTTVPGWQQSWVIPREIGAEVSLMVWTPGTPFDVDALDRLVRPGTRLISLVSPGNPSGCLIDSGTWTALIDIAERHGIWILVDEEFQVNLQESVVNRYPRAVSVAGLSKVYGLPGLRVGWAVAGSEEGGAVIEDMVNYKRYLTMCNSSLSERVALAALTDRSAHVERYRGLLSQGRQILDRFAADMADSLQLVPPVDTPFAWFNLPGPISSAEFAERLLKEHRVLIMPAEVFGAERGFRLTYARPLPVLEPGLDRIRTLIGEVAGAARPSGRVR
ncbi:pyridoxal phosphate-dependent aminotransferase [Microbispora sp. RL4-1S]|uniref:Aminotransferase n=1 Tax=Microbispora oryzae TaxID=2806554 RepID=A0A940WRR7_9ACTN|nr:pyridoxal phosphate-dependent aminotransferase [Microbispora oryzae]MBP2705861.1 pyridoxal phosphate-dependent aminotransferase [Microbispora oryzae]